MIHPVPTLPAPSTGGADLKPSEALRAARVLITPEGAWTQQKSAREKNGTGVAPTSAKAVCFCSVGSVWHLGMTLDQDTVVTAYLDKACGGCIVEFNDDLDRTQAEVLDVFDCAAALAEADEAAAARADAGRGE